MVYCTASTSGDYSVDEVDVTENDLATHFSLDAMLPLEMIADMRNILPTNEDDEIITDRSRISGHSAGMPKGGMAARTDHFRVEKEFSSPTKFAGVDFKKFRGDMPKRRTRTEQAFEHISSHSGIADDQKKIQNKK